MACSRKPTGMVLIAIWCITLTLYNLYCVVTDDGLLAGSERTNSDIRGCKCRMSTICSGPDEIPYRVTSGVAYLVGPSVCVDGRWLMGNSLNNVGRGLNVVTVDAMTGMTTDARIFDVYKESGKRLRDFLKGGEVNDIVFFATFDDGSMKLDNATRDLIAEMGSLKIKKLAFRDNWVFVGSKLLNRYSQEKHLPYVKGNNQYDKWPNMVSIEGCIPKIQKSN